MIHKHLPKFNEEGTAHFVTTKTHLNTPLFKHPALARIVLEELAFYRKQNSFYVLGYVVMPDHFHGIIRWDCERHPDLTISRTMQSFKGSIARRIIDEILEPKNERPRGSIEYQLNAGKRETLRRKLSVSHTRARDDPENRAHRRNWKYKIWQTGFYDFNIFSREKLNEKLKYIHYNPVKAGLCKEEEQYLFSSAWFYAGLKQPEGLEGVVCFVEEL